MASLVGVVVVDRNNRSLMALQDVPIGKIVASAFIALCSDGRGYATRYGLLNMIQDRIKVNGRTPLRFFIDDIADMNSVIVQANQRRIYFQVGGRWQMQPVAKFGQVAHA